MGLCGVAVVAAFVVPSVSQTIYGGGGCFFGIACQAKSLSVNGAAIGANAVAVTGSSVFTGLVTVNNTVAAAGNLTAGGASLVGWTNRSSETSPSDGVVEITNNAANGFTRLDLGGTTSSFPALAPNGSALQIVGADGAALTALDAGRLDIGGTTANVAFGEIGSVKISASGSAPGAGFGKLSWVAGTTGSSCKLIAYAGTSTTPVTIVDNVGTGC